MFLTTVVSYQQNGGRDERGTLGAAGDEVALRFLEREEGLGDLDLESRQALGSGHEATCSAPWRVTTDSHACRTVADSTSSSHRSTNKAPST